MDPNQFPSHQQDDITPDYIADDVGISQEQMDMIQEHHDAIRSNEDPSQLESLSPVVIAPLQDLGHRPYAWKEPVAAPLRENLNARQERLGGRSKEAVRLLGEFAMFHVETVAKAKDAVVGAAKKLKRPKKTDNEVLPEPETEFEPALEEEQLDLPIVPTVDIADQPTEELDNVYPIAPDQPRRNDSYGAPESTLDRVFPRIAGGASIDAFLDPTNSPETAELRNRANYLQSLVENILRAIPEKKANSISLENELNRHSQEFTCLVSSAEFEKEQNFTLKEGGLKLLEKGLIAGVVPTLDQLGRLQSLFNNQQIDKVMQDKNGNSHPGFTTNPRYLRRGLPGFGPYSSPEDDTVERISQLIEPNTWELTNEDEAYLLRMLSTDELTKYKHAPAPSGQVHFWNREPFNFYLKKGYKDFGEKIHGRPSAEEQRKQKMADPAVRAGIALSGSIIDWWRSSVGKTYVGKSAIEKANLDEIMLRDLKTYIKARIDLSDQI